MPIYTDEEKRNIQELLNKEQYDQLFQTYGSKAYKSFVPRGYRKKDLYKLKKEGKFEDIFRKYGSSGGMLNRAEYRDRKNTAGTRNAVMWNLLTGAKHVAAVLGIASLFVFPGVKIYAQQENSILLESSIEAYNKRNQEYAKEFEGKNFNELQIIMAVMDNMWSEIKGYGNPQIDAMGYWGLDIGREDGVGVCRHMASYFADVLNLIHPEFNAETISVYMKNVGRYYIADIERKFLTGEETGDEKNRIVKTIEEQLIGNHEIVIAHIGDKLFGIDPTNLMISWYHNGNFYVLNDTDNGQPIVMAGRALATAYTKRPGDFREIQEEFAQSFNDPDFLSTYNELKSILGTESQSEAIEYTREVFRNTSKGLSAENELSKTDGVYIRTEDIQRAIENGENTNKIANNIQKNIDKNQEDIEYESK